MHFDHRHVEVLQDLAVGRRVLEGAQSVVDGVGHYRIDADLTEELLQG